MRDKLFTEKFELCLTKEQKKIVKELAKRNKTRMNDVIRQAIMEMWEKI